MLNPSDQVVTDLFPHWGEMVRIFFTGHSLLENSIASNSMRSGMHVDSVSVFGNFSASKINAYGPAINYCKRMVLLQALKGTDTELTIDADWERQLDMLVRTDLLSRNNMKRHLQSVDAESQIIYLQAAFEGMLWNEGNGLPDCGTCFTQIAALSPGSAMAQLASRADELIPSISSNKAETRLVSAQAFGMLVSHPANTADYLAKMAQTLLATIQPWDIAIGGDANRVHGSILAMGHLLSRAVYYGREADLKEDTIQEVVGLLFRILESTKIGAYKEAVFITIGHLAVSNLLTNDRIHKSMCTISTVVDKILSEAKKGDERAISALGRIALYLDDNNDEGGEKPLTTTLEKLYELQEIRQAEIQFTVGEALSCASGGWNSESLQLAFDVDAQYQGRMRRSGIITNMMDKLLKGCKNTKPSLKKASGIWLFCLIQYCGQLSEIQTRLRECQAAFMGLLSARDDIVQETASRGLSLVYEAGDKELKERLVRDLVASFTGTPVKVNVEEDTELFEPGALPTGEGKSITSYRDIMSLAAEVGDQSLVYKFMSLASNAATWTTRAAFGRFGLSNILSESDVDPKLYPKLYRYRFDPNPNVQRSMNDIWSALVKNSSATIDTHFDAIIDDLLKSILTKEWRTRQASCAAIADLVQGRKFEKYEPYLGQIWEVAFKVLDDIKGSVREAAMSLCKVLTGILVRQVEAGEGSSPKNAQTMLENVLPFLLSTQGLESSAKEVQFFALTTVLKLVKSGGKTLLPFVPNLVEQLLGLLSTLEPEAVSMVYQNAAKYNLTGDQIDAARASAISGSPMMESIERCMDILDEPTMKELVPALERVIKTAVGVPTKLACSKVLASLATRQSFVFRSHADTFLRVIEKAVLDRNPTVNSGYAGAAGYVARLASDKQLLRLANYVKDLYFNAEDERNRLISADLIFSVSKQATDRFNSLSSDFLPFVFFAKHDINEPVQEHFQKTWDDNVAGSRAVLLYLKEILSLSLSRLESPKWTIKHTAALTIADTASSAGAEISDSNAKAIWPALEKALALKTFDGKEKVLEAFVKFAKGSKPFWEKDPAITAQMKKIAIREAKRNNDDYRPHAFDSLGEYCKLRLDLDMFVEVHDIVALQLGEVINGDKMDIEDDGKTGQTSSTDIAIINASTYVLFRAINTSKNGITHLAELLNTLRPIMLSSKADNATRSAFYEGAKDVLDDFRNLNSSSANSGSSDAGLLMLSLLELPSGSGSEIVRTKRAEAAEVLVLATTQGVFETKGLQELLGKVREDLREGRLNERSSAVQAILDRTLMVLA